ncbi:amino acid permease [Corynebacterium tapiri]|uniref:Amino acid permease n=1 Tax=Corynebacterium tapiri TaxID=1448266 RepID=A0A5C4U2M6_9CORY|nr:amino acid permease [Corynebacterium tapiri]TNL96805.1 amino acid permease [Corynebacterium tapiri]
MTGEPRTQTAPAAPGLKHRHLHFIALGSAIGTGLFYGSAEAIQAAGPSVLLVYLLGGAVVYFMLRALGEMAVRNPITGSFAEYARAHLGGWAGYITGWMFAFEMIIVCLADLTAVGIYMKFWFPDVSQWIWVAATLLIVGAANLASVKVFGELEFGFTIIKVGAVVAMIIGGAAVLAFGLSGAHETGPHNLVAHGGFFPNGIGGMISAFILVLFAFGGTEIIGVAGVEAENPEKSVPRAINTVPFRILLFYVLAILIILMINPWNTITGEESPFVQIFDALGVTWAAALLNVVVITAALSAINADLFGAGRVLTGLARENLAPAIMAKTRRGVPVMTTVILLAVLVIGVVLNAFLPEKVFTIVASLATFATVYVWLMILLAHLASRRGMTKADVAKLEYRVPFWPFGQYFAVGFILATFLIMAWIPDFRLALGVGIAFLAIMSILYFTIYRRSRTS